ncbi:MAG: metal-dependent hydrolase [Actinomycetota bacterium]
MTDLCVRRPGFAFPDDADPMWTPGAPEFACAANAVSLLMPHMEPYFVRSIAAVGAELPDEVAADARAYVAQEGAHQREHRRFNRLLATRYRGLGPLDRAAARVYGHLGRRRSAGFNVAFTAASETIAYSAARWAAERRRELFGGADSALADLFIWHLAEEVEHKGVAWDVHRALGGTRRRYLAAAVLAVALTALFVVAGTVVMTAAERRLHRPVAWLRLIRWGLTFAFELLPNLAVALSAGHHPDRFTDPLWYEVWLREYAGAQANAQADGNQAP